MSAAQFPHPPPCDCVFCRIYGERHQLVMALNNPAPKALLDTIKRQWRRYTILNEVYLEALSRVAQPGARQ